MEENLEKTMRWVNKINEKWKGIMTLKNQKRNNLLDYAN